MIRAKLEGVVALRVIVMDVKLAPLFDPSARRPSPKPLQVDLRKVFSVITVLWLIALIVCLILNACGVHGMPPAITITASGTIIGVLLLIWEYFDRWDYRRLGA